MKTIWKFSLAILDYQTVIMPVGATILHVGLDPSGVLCLWALVDVGKPYLPRQIWIRGTGHAIEDNLEYLGSVVQGSFVWHVFEACL